MLGVLSLSITVPAAGWAQAYKRCGHAPVVASNVFAGYDYTVPGDPRYDVGSFPLNMPIYYCTAQEAEDNGYHHITSS